MTAPANLGDAAEIARLRARYYDKRREVAQVSRSARQAEGALMSKVALFYKVAHPEFLGMGECPTSVVTTHVYDAMRERWLQDCLACGERRDRRRMPEHRPSLRVDVTT